MFSTKCGCSKPRVNYLQRCPFTGQLVPRKTSCRRAYWKALDPQSIVRTRLFWHCDDCQCDFCVDATGPTDAVLFNLENEERQLSGSDINEQSSVSPRSESTLHQDSNSQAFEPTPAENEVIMETRSGIDECGPYIQPPIQTGELEISETKIDEHQEVSHFGIRLEKKEMAKTQTKKVTLQYDEKTVDACPPGTAQITFSESPHPIHPYRNKPGNSGGVRKFGNKSYNRRFGQRGV